ncbi:MAG: chemotaxis-specific protein-glutamate methyltransferase CheB [Lachnospiraceae bacterium]|nr:chemotaxis-specific protein-glutamate methyltransferase CheB [Lachnospiraceae bacterium]
MKKILLVDDSALMRSVLGAIINSDPRFSVEDRASDGLEALEYLKKQMYDAVVLDVNMPRMDGITLLKELRKAGIHARVMMLSTDTTDGAKVTMDALELGALDFIHKPSTAAECRAGSFSKEMLDTLYAVSESRAADTKAFSIQDIQAERKVADIVSHSASKVTGNRIVAIASSTGGPRALQSVIPHLPKNLKTPVVLVQHMPVGFTASLAERLNSLSELSVKEAEDGEEIRAGYVYIARGGTHMEILTRNGKHTIRFKEAPPREGVKPCANYMYESLADSDYDEIVCVVMTGMGADGTEGIRNLKKKKKVHVIAQDADTSTVYGMPKAVASSGLTDQVVPLSGIATEIVLNAGVT